MFDAKTVVITGGSSGIGKVLARRFFGRGAHLALIARDESRLVCVKEELLRTVSGTQKIETFSCDVSHPEAVEETFREIPGALGPPDILVNSAGILREGYFETLSVDTFREVMDINFFGTLHCIQAVLPLFRKTGGGRIVNVCSLAGFMGVFGYAAYCSSKHAVAGLSSTLRAELMPQNIRVHLVCPPEFESPMVDELNTCRPPENREIVGTLPVLDVETVADEIFRGIERDRYEIIPGRVARMARRMDRLVPSLGRNLADRTLRRCYRGPQQRTKGKTSTE